MNNFSRALLSSALVGVFLTACGGGSDDPEPTPIAATLNVSNATSTNLNGAYNSNAVALSEVSKVNPIGGEPEVCSFRFSGLQGPNGGMMDGDIRYIPGTTQLRVIFVSINGLEFVSREPVNAL